MDGLSVVLNVVLLVAILGFFGVETTTFAALLAAGGVAVGVAWGGLLSNFAAGAFLVFLRPFKVGDGWGRHWDRRSHWFVRHDDQHARQRADHRGNGTIFAGPFRTIPRTRIVAWT